MVYIETSEVFSNAADSKYLWGESISTNQQIIIIYNSMLTLVCIYLIIEIHPNLDFTIIPIVAYPMATLPENLPSIGSFF